MSGDFKIGSRVVQPSLNSIVCNGIAKHLEPKMMEVLVCLAEKQGEVISKERLMRAVWADTFVTDDVLTRCISELRRVFQDDPKEPQVIETIPRKGYRLVVPVELVAKASRRKLVVYAIIPALLVVSGAYFLMHRAPKLTSKDAILLADFSNSTGDPVFDGTLRQGLTAQLEQSPYLDIVSDEQIGGTLGLMGQPAGTRLTHELARQVCQRTGGAAVLEGSIAQIGTQYNLVLNAVNCSTGALVTSTQAVASDKNHVLGALGSVGSAIRQRLGESLASIQKFNTPLEEVTTPSLEALQAYTLGWHTHLSGDDSAAAGSFERAISLDRNFAMAYAVLGNAYFNLSETSLAAENTTKAYELRDRVSELEKFYISSHYEELVTGDILKANQIFELWAQTYPQNAVPVTDLTLNDLLLGQYQKALAPARRALELDPDAANSYGNLADSYLCLDRLHEAAAILEQAKAHGIYSLVTDAAAYELAFLEDNTAGVARETAWAAGKPGVEDLFLDYESDTAAYAGHLTQANELTARAVASARQAGQKETAALYLAEAALREALVGNVAEARHRAATALQTSNGRHTGAVAALTFAFTGDVVQAQKLANDLAKRFPEDTIAQFNYLPTIRAVIALRQKSPAKAIADLQGASPYELGTPALLIFVNLYPVYVRGQAYLAAGKGESAAAEFQKILDHRGIAFNEVIVPLAYLGLGRARALSGDTPGTRKAYQDFFALWQHADPNLPILQQAQAEYGKLK